MDHSLHTPLEASELTEAYLVDAWVYGPEDEKIGTVGHMHGSGPAAQVVLDVGGFLGIGTKHVALDVSSLNFMRDEDGDIHATTAWTRDQITALPDHLADI